MWIVNARSMDAFYSAGVGKFLSISYRPSRIFLVTLPSSYSNYEILIYKARDPQFAIANFGIVVLKRYQCFPLDREQGGKPRSRIIMKLKSI